MLGDKRGDNGQVETIVDALDWPVEHKYVHMRPEYVLGKPLYHPSLDHLDLERSDPIKAPWPDLIITVGRRPSMAALWVRQQSGFRTKIVLVGKPSGYMLDFSLVIASAENQMPPLHNFVATTLPLMRVSPADVACAAQEWKERFAGLQRPLIAMLIGGETNPFIMNRKVADDLVATAAARLMSPPAGAPRRKSSRYCGGNCRRSRFSSNGQPLPRTIPTAPCSAAPTGSSSPRTVSP